jgi:5-enolpyruvylshikimate-3-phosphate synthase
MKEVLRKAGNSQVTETYIEAGRSYSDHRIALQAAIVQWPQTLFPLAPK